MKSCESVCLGIMMMTLAWGCYHLLYPRSTWESFSMSPLGLYPSVDDKVLLTSYPAIGSNETSNMNYSDIWKEYPMTPMSSFLQMTNNQRYHSNPDNGHCIRADFCNAIYRNQSNIPSNVVEVLPPVEEGNGPRIGYFRESDW